MAEVIVGFVSAGVGIAAFALQISKSIDALRQMRLRPGEARKDLTTLLEILEILHQAVSLLKAWEGYQPVDGIIQHVQKRYDKIEPALQDLLEKYQEKGEGHGRQWKRVLARHPKQQIRDLREDINEIINILNLAFMAAQCQPPSIEELTAAGNTNADPSQAQEGDVHLLEHEGDAGETEMRTNTVTNPSSKSHQEHRVVLSMARTSSNVCGARRYDCSCHLTSVSGRFWFLQYTPLSSFIGKPNDKASGCRCMSLRLRMALSRFGVPYAIVASIGFQVDGPGVELRPALRTERIVNYTSPGFETIWRLENGFISLSDARARFIQLYQSEGPLRDHKDPAGNSYIQTLFRYPWKFAQDDQFALLDTLVTECEMTLTGETQSFLVQCAHWIGEGRHLALLDAILEHGFDVTAIHTSHLEQWPAPCSPDWYGAGRTPDPFFIDYVGTMLRYCPSYSGSTNLHNVLLNGPFNSAAYWLERSQPLETNVNFLGQTPLHIAATSPELCRIVLDAGHDVNVTDSFGATPLMYAAAMGQAEVTKLLISRGAKIALRDSRLQWTFLDYAFFCGHWDLALDALLNIQTMVDSSIFQCVVQYALIRALGHHRALAEDTTFLTEVVQLSDDVNFTFGDGDVKDNNLMHYAHSLEMASTLVRCGFNGFNQKNSEGKLAINSLANCYNAPLIQFCLENELSSLNWMTWDIIDSIKLCLSAGADPFITDDCICPCSPDGCHVSSMFGLEFGFCWHIYHSPGPVWTFELLTLLEEYHGIEAAEKLLLSLHRRVQCDKPHISIAHVCCHRGRGVGQRDWVASPRLQDEEIEEILDEESEFITALDMDMDQIASFGFSNLRTEFMIHLKGKYDVYKEDTKREAEEYTAASKLDNQRYEVDYRADTYKLCSPMYWWPAYTIAQSMAEYAFWLQHETSRANKPLVRDFHKAGWFERRISWFLELMDVMEVTMEMLETDMESLRVKETRTEKIDPTETARSFLEALEEVRDKDCERETG
ncbi:hypothetical protein MRS44_001846 [Fusarium solani]|uniref:uncharacterized protein n=1 Tax=Fusarium solani TaxID=169388 RepID=UPI0032C477DD|nr:hypothetical protein MRS44_001846 [Fusarium solani]